MHNRFQENRRTETSVKHTAKLEAKQEKAVEIVKTMLENNETNERIAKYTGLAIE